MAFPAANADRDAALRELFGLDISADALLQQELRASQGRAPSRILPPSPAIAGSSGDLSALFCPVPGCARAHGNGPAWGSRDALRAHVDLHLVGELRGRPSDAWLESLQLRCCRVCGKSISCRIASMVHVAGPKNVCINKRLDRLRRRRYPLRTCLRCMIFSLRPSTLRSNCRPNYGLCCARNTVSCWLGSIALPR